jgi:hypothetical protein
MECKASSGFFDHLFNPYCGLNISSTCDKQTWINCRVSQTKTGVLVFFCIMLIYSLYVYLAGADLTKLLTLIFAPFICAGILISAYYWTSKYAAYEWDQFEIRIAALTKLYGDRTKAIAQYMEEEKQKKEAMIRAIAAKPITFNINTNKKN